MTTTCDAVESGNDYRNRMLHEEKDNWLEDIKYLLSVVNIGSTDVTDKDKYVNMMSELVEISEKFTEKEWSRKFVYFTSATMIIYVCTPKFYMATI